MRRCAQAIAARYGVAFDRAFPVSGGTSYANWLGCLAALDGCSSGAEVIVERPHANRCKIRGRSATACGGSIAASRTATRSISIFASLVTAKTRLAVVTNLHNPSGARIPMATLRALAALLARVKAYLLVDEVYLEWLFRCRPESCVHAGLNVLATNSLTKAYGLDGLRAGWLLGPAPMIPRAQRISDLITDNSVAPGERMALAAFRRHRDIDRRAHDILDPNLARVRTFFAREPRLRAVMPEGGNVVFPRLPSAIDSDRFVRHLVIIDSTLVVRGGSSRRAASSSVSAAGRRCSRAVREHLARARRFGVNPRFAADVSYPYGSIDDQRIVQGRGRAARGRGEEGAARRQRAPHRHQAGGADDRGVPLVRRGRRRRLRAGAGRGRRYRRRHGVPVEVERSSA
jgi:aspartate/methionine/tyrosine aminotransferase